MNRVQINRVEEWKRWLLRKLYSRGVFLIETSLSDNELVEVVNEMKRVLRLRFFCSSDKFSKDLRKSSTKNKKMHLLLLLFHAEFIVNKLI